MGSRRYKVVRANPRGRLGEDYAAEELTRLGYTVLERNYSCYYGEVDIIARKGDVVAFVEVKTRRPDSMITGFEAVTRQKQRKIIVTALHWIKAAHCALQPRFDIFSVVASNGEVFSHDYLEGAFDGGAYAKAAY